VLETELSYDFNMNIGFSLFISLLAQALLTKTANHPGVAPKPNAINRSSTGAYP
jgi:hypothetical protein